jgi:hypothetical protein
VSSACSHFALLGREFVETVVGELVTVVCELLYFATVAAEVEQDEDDDYDDEGDNTAYRAKENVLASRLWRWQRSLREKCTEQERTYPPATITPRFSFVDCAGFSHVFICALLTHLGLINVDRTIFKPRRRRLSEGRVVVVSEREAIAARAAGGVVMSRGCSLPILFVCLLVCLFDCPCSLPIGVEVLRRRSNGF